MSKIYVNFVVFILCLFSLSNCTAQSQLNINRKEDGNFTITTSEDTLNIFLESELCHLGKFIDFTRFDSVQRKNIYTQVIYYLAQNGYEQVEKSNNNYFKWIFDILKSKKDIDNKYVSYHYSYESRTFFFEESPKTYWMHDNRLYIIDGIVEHYMRSNSITENNKILFVSDCTWNDNGMKLRHKRITRVGNSDKYLIVYEGDGSIYIVNKHNLEMLSLDTSIVKNAYIHEGNIKLVEVGSNKIVNFVFWK